MGSFITSHTHSFNYTLSTIWKLGHKTLTSMYEDIYRSQRHQRSHKEAGCSFYVSSHHPQEVLSLKQTAMNCVLYCVNSLIQNLSSYLVWHVQNTASRSEIIPRIHQLQDPPSNNQASHAHQRPLAAHEVNSIL